MLGVAGRAGCYMMPLAHLHMQVHCQLDHAKPNDMLTDTRPIADCQIQLALADQS